MRCSTVVGIELILCALAVTERARFCGRSDDWLVVVDVVLPCFGVPDVLITSLTRTDCGTLWVTSVRRNPSQPHGLATFALILCTESIDTSIIIDKQCKRHTFYIDFYIRMKWHFPSRMFYAFWKRRRARCGQRPKSCVFSFFGSGSMWSLNPHKNIDKQSELIWDTTL